MGYNYSVLTCNYSVLTCNGPVRGHSNTVLLQWAGGDLRPAAVIRDGVFGHLCQIVSFDWYIFHG